MSQGIHLRKYGVAATVPFELYEVDGVDFRVDWTPAAGDVFMMRDEAAEEQVTNAAGNADLSTLVTDEGRGYSITLALEDMQAARVVVYLVDQATKAFLDKAVIIETYGNAAAQHAMDFDDAVRGGLTSLPNAAADAAGGLPISDAGALDLDTQLANTNEVTAARMGALTDWINGGRLDLLLDAIPTTAMRGTDNAALASVVGALADAAAAGDPTNADTIMQYVKQLINTIEGTAGIPAFPAEAAPGNDVSLAEVIRAIHADVTGLNGDVMVGTNGANTTVPDAAGVAPTAVENRTEMDNNSTELAAILADVTGINGDAMRGTDGANTTVPDAAGVAPTAVENRQEMDSNSTELAKIGTIPALDGAGQTIGAAIAKLADDNGGADFDAGTDSLQEIRDRGDAAWITGGGGGGDATEAKQDTIIAAIGTPANIDAGGATIADNLKKMADDNGGANYDATTDSLERLANTAPLGTAMRGTDGANTTVPDAAGVAATPAEVATALTNIHLDHLLAANYDPAAKPGVATALLNELVEDDGGVSRYTANALEEAPSGAGLTATQDGNLTFMREVAEGDAVIDTSGTPWQLVVTQRTSGAELIRKDLKDVAGGNVVATSTVIGQQTEP